MLAQIARQKPLPWIDEEAAWERWPGPDDVANNRMGPRKGRLDRIQPGSIEVLTDAIHPLTELLGGVVLCPPRQA